MKRAGIFLITVALVVGMVGCDTTARQATPQYDLTIASTAGGSVTTHGEGTFTYDEGTVVDLVAVADECYEFVNWTDDTVADPNSATTTVTMDADKNVIANLSLLSYNLTIDSTQGGSVHHPGEGTFTHGCGTVVDLVVETNDGYHFVSWTGDVAAITNVNAASTTITVNDNYSITANFGEGDVAPDFTLPTMTGADITLSELIGTPVVVNFWSISCYWCRKQLPYLENVAQQSEGKIKVIAINMGESASRIQDFFGDYEPTMIVALDSTRETFRDYCLKYNNPRGAIPFTLFVDSEGIMQYNQTGAFRSETELWDTLDSVF